MSAKPTQVHLGFEVGSGAPVEIPVRHMAVLGQTQESGKTTTLEALITRSGLSAVAFLTKPGEASFGIRGKRILPFFQERADWQYVQSILESVMRQGQQFKQPWIMRACEGAHTLADVQHRCRLLGATTKNSMSQDMYMVLDEYFKKVIPLLSSLPKARRIDLTPGELAVMDLRDYPEELQMLVIASTLEWIHKHERGVITVVPEAWMFVPQGKNTPVKVVAEKLARQGAGLRNYLWIDSQDIAGVEKIILRGCAVWLIGVQRDSNELKRAIASMPEGLKRPKSGEIATLELGQFFACYGREIRKTYVQPAWMSEGEAEAISKGELDIGDIKLPADHPVVRREQVNQLLDVDPLGALELAKGKLESGDSRAALEIISAALQAKSYSGAPAAPAAAVVRAGAAGSGQAAPVHTSASSGEWSQKYFFDNEQLYQAIKDRLAEEAPQILSVVKMNPEIEVTLKREKIQMDTKTLDGRIAVLIAEGFFDDRRGNKDTLEELASRGWPDAAPNVSKAFGRMLRTGFLREVTSGRYQAVAGMKVNVVEAA